MCTYIHVCIRICVSQSEVHVCVLVCVVRVWVGVQKLRIVFIYICRQNSFSILHNFEQKTLGLNLPDAVRM